MTGGRVGSRMFFCPRNCLDNNSSLAIFIASLFVNERHARLYASTLKYLVSLFSVMDDIFYRVLLLVYLL